MRTYRDDADEISKNTGDEYSTGDEPRQKSFYENNGFDERDGPSRDEDEQEERGRPGLMTARTGTVKVQGSDGSVPLSSEPFALDPFLHDLCLTNNFE